MAWQAWEAVIPELAKDFEVIGCDSPGFGESATLRHAGPPTIHAYADAYELWLSEQGIERPHVAGNSMGGGIALELARRGVVSSATAFSPVGFWSDAERKWCQLVVGQLHGVPAPLHPIVRRIMRTTRGRNQLGALLYRWPSKVEPDAAVAALDRVWTSPGLKAALAAFSHYDFEPRPEPMPVPTTVAWGNRDRLLLFRPQSARARSALPDAVHVTLGAGHLPMTDDPPAVTAAIRATARRAG